MYQSLNNQLDVARQEELKDLIYMMDHNDNNQFTHIKTNTKQIGKGIPIIKFAHALKVQRKLKNICC